MNIKHYHQGYKWNNFYIRLKHYKIYNIYNKKALINVGMFHFWNQIKVLRVMLIQIAFQCHSEWNWWSFAFIKDIFDTMIPQKNIMHNVKCERLYLSSVFGCECMRVVWHLCVFVLLKSIDKDRYDSYPIGKKREELI